MREIKFRAWVKEHVINPRDWSPNNPDDPKTIPGEMTYCYNPVAHGELNIFDFSFVDKGYVVMQYTGLKDKNGREIYEGDVLGGGGGHNFLVEWSDVKAGWVFRSESAAVHAEYPLGNIYDGETAHFSKKEVIGNIYENPELLDGKPHS